MRNCFSARTQAGSGSSVIWTGLSTVPKSWASWRERRLVTWPTNRNFASRRSSKRESTTRHWKISNNNYPNMQLGVFSTDENKSGFRLQYMELFNWGTFDEHVWKIAPGGETSLLTGANGSGKTTLVDALLTLIVPEKRYRFYNQSSGSEKKGDRTEESYVMGGYSTLQSDNGGATKTLYLRENKEAAYSILLASFANESGQAVTLFQVRYFGSGDLKRVFAVAHLPLHIEEHFRPFDAGGVWRK